MKKLLILTAVFASLLAGFTACKEDDTIIINPCIGGDFPSRSAIGELSYNPEDNNYYFKTTDCSDKKFFKQLKDKIIPISNVSLRLWHIENIAQYIGNVEVVFPMKEIEDSLYVELIKRLESDNEGRFITP